MTEIYEPGAEGLPQAVIPGAERRPQATMLALAAAAPLKPRKPQRAPGSDGGLFDAQGQMPLL